MSRNLPQLLMGYAVVIGGTLSFVAANASAQDRDLDTFSLRVTDAAFSYDQTYDSELERFSASSANSRHAEWVTDLESKAWPGFLTGLPGYDDFVLPVGMFTYFEDPFITTDVRLMYVYNGIPDRSELGNGRVHLAAVALRVALTERLAFISTKDGYTWFDSETTPAGDGWNDIAFGLKYAVYSNPDEQLLVTAGMRWELVNGSSDVWQGGDSQELSPFISVAKGWDKWHFLGALSGRIPMDRGDANASVVWNMHLDYELTDTFRPLVELHGIHWLSNADLLSMSSDYLDVGSLGASDASGRDFFSAGIGFRWQAMDNVSVGLTWEFPLESPASNLMDQRVTLNTAIRF